MNQTPNILWVCTDQQRWDTLGCLGNPYVQTPVLDRLAAEGVLFEEAYCQSPVCSPSRASFMTGRLPRTARCRQNGQNIPEDEVLVTKRLADAGYHCGLSGKLHLSACLPKACVNGVERRIDDGYAEFHWSQHPAPAWGRNNAYWAWLEDNGIAYPKGMIPQSTFVERGIDEEWGQTKWCVDRAIDCIHSHRDKNRPWLFSVNIFDPHHAFDPPPDRLARYEPFLNDIPLPDFLEGELDTKPAYQKRDSEGAYGGVMHYERSKMREADHRWVRAAYWAMCDAIDTQVGRLLEALESTGQREDTLVIFMSDHGEMLGDHGIYLKGPYFYEPAIRVPLIFSWPGQIEPRRVSTPVELIDIAPTLLEAAGLPMEVGMQGHSLLSVLRDASRNPTQRDVYCEYYDAMPWHKDPPAQMTMLRTERYKLVVDHLGEGGELYDLQDDPKEFVNRWHDPQFGVIRADLLLRLCHRMAASVDPKPLRQAIW